MSGSAETTMQGPDVTSPGERTQTLAAALRALASRAAESVDGGLALVFASAPGEHSIESAARLRTAAGFAVPQQAREVSQKLLAHVREALEGERWVTPSTPPALGERAAGSLVIIPLVFEGRVHGAMAVGSPAPLTQGQTAVLEQLAELLALRLDHAHVCEELAVSQSRTDEGEDVGDEKNEEILKLSEALFAQDIELLRSNEKLGKVEKLKNDFIEKMSRELRTPLNSIIEAIISVLTGENEAISESSKTSLRTALDEGTAFLRTLQNILDLWRIKQGELPVEIQDVNLREVVDEAIFSVQDAVGSKPVAIEPAIPDPFPKFRTDLAKLNQILFLLLDNAAKFTERGRVEIAARMENESLVCEIRDTGIGICQDDVQFIFDEFYQVDEPSSQRYRGAGLGMALVRDLVVLLEGEIAVQSDVGRGTTVIFEIPVQLPA